jgi:hypothetical protein
MIAMLCLPASYAEAGRTGDQCGIAVGTATRDLAESFDQLDAAEASGSVEICSVFDRYRGAVETWIAIRSECDTGAQLEALAADLASFRDDVADRRVAYKCPEASGSPAP